MSGPEAFSSVTECLAGYIGQALVLMSLLSLCYHLMNGIRHLVWDTTNLLELEEVYQSGWAMLIATLVLFAVVIWVAS